MADVSDLIQLAQGLVKQGPHKAEQTARRVRGQLSGEIVFDTTEAYHVWEIPNYPQYYVPIASVTQHATLARLEPIEGTDSAAFFGRLAVGQRSTNRVIIFDTEKLKNLVRIEFRVLDQWLEEETPIFCHPKDPYKRIDILYSQRPVKVALDGVTLAESAGSMFLLETSLRMRYYLPPESIKWEYLDQSDTTTMCPYKGTAGYHDVIVNGRRYRDLVWYYQCPERECAPVAGFLCFYNERVDIWVDGVKEKR